jgi:NAD(P)-dependent dehydrogenase (short-subunit alcohol dehydrogenase family)
MDPVPRAVLVTGCSSGIGRATAQRLAGRGFRVFAGVRSEAQGADLVALGSPLLTPIPLEVLDAGQVERALQTIEAESPRGLFGLVNNAGVGFAAAAELTTADELRAVLEVNTVAPFVLTQRCLPLLRRGGGRIVNVSSMNGVLTLPMTAAYSASKQALEGLSDALRAELMPWRIPVSLVRPGQVRTPIFAKTRDQIAEQTARIPPELREPYEAFYRRAAHFNERGTHAQTQPDDVAKKVLCALESRWPRTHYHVGWDALGMRLAMRCLPVWVLDRLLARMMGLLRRVDR